MRLQIMAGEGSDARHRIGNVERDRRIVWTLCGIRTALMATPWDVRHWPFLGKRLHDCEGCR